jgi:hypothetical protein
MPPLYKFIGDPQVARSCLEGAVKFTPVAELNDPSELNPNLNRAAMRDSLQLLRTRGYSEDEFDYLCRQHALLNQLVPELQAIPAPDTREAATRQIQSKVYDISTYMERMMSETAKSIASKVGIFCLSRRFDSLPMWAHYAANATGFVVELVKLKSVFAGDGTGVLWEPREVSYGSEIEGMTFNPQSHESLFFSKFSDWSYEQEVRVILPLHSCRSKETQSGNLYLYDVPSITVSRIILGWKMERSHVEDIKSAALDLNPQVRVVRAQFLNGSVRILNAGGAS